jgi:hypothetical protein
MVGLSGSGTVLGGLLGSGGGTAEGRGSGLARLRKKGDTSGSFIGSWSETSASGSSASTADEGDSIACAVIVAFRTAFR